MGQAKCRSTKIRPQAAVGGIFGRFSNFVRCRAEAAGDIISGVEHGGIDVLVKFGDSRSNSYRYVFEPLTLQWTTTPADGRTLY